MLNLSTACAFICVYTVTYILFLQDEKFIRIVELNKKKIPSSARLHIAWIFYLLCMRMQVAARNKERVNRVHTDREKI